MGGSGFGVRQMGPTSWKILGKSESLPGPQFPICKMGTILLGSDEVVIKCQVS